MSSFRPFLLLLSMLPALAFGMELSCTGELNGAEQFRSTVQLEAGQRFVPVGFVNEMEIFMSDMSNQRVELQLYNPIEPSRSYATAHVQSAGDQVQLSLWTREFWIEVKCTKM